MLRIKYDSALKIAQQHTFRGLVAYKMAGYKKVYITSDICDFFFCGNEHLHKISIWKIDQFELK